ncbi:OPT oligopeptide transporter protein-domain-containing protein [Lactifluus subvellereus]|nr:OPT oligopeptide transporter protein-domain-containing protein [Lactifluus subvellereus]
MSLLEDETRSVNPERRDPEHLEKGVDLDNYDDPNFDPTGSILQDDSPYAEVRSAVANTDDPMMPSSTFRAWVVGIILAVLILVSLFGISFNPGPFTIKEHVITSIMANVGSGPAYATDIIAVQRVFYNQHPNFVLAVVMSTQLIGFSIAGICKRILVAPPSMIWPETLSAAALFNTLHAKRQRRFFTYVFIGYFFYNFLPSYLFTALSPSHGSAGSPPTMSRSTKFSVALTAWVWSHNLRLGCQYPFGSPLTVPWWAAANVGIAVVIPTQYSNSFDNTGNIYNAYQSYSPVFLSMSFAIAYGLSFASITAVLMHTLLYNSKQILTQSRRSLSDQPDIHARLMSVYKEVPDWWYLFIFLTTFAFGLNVITELIIGYALPGRPIAMMMFKTWGYLTMIVGTVVAGTVQLGVQTWMFSHIEDICSPHQKDNFTCPTPLGWILHKKFGMKFLKYLNFPVVFTAITMPPATPFNFVPWVFICFLFNYVIRRRHMLWWLKCLAAGLDAGMPSVHCDLLRSAVSEEWYHRPEQHSELVGQYGHTKTADYAGLPAKTVPEGGTFGPSSW